MSDEAHAYVFPNGSVMYFDEDGDQMNSLQKDRMHGLPEFKYLFPDARIFFASGLSEDAERFELSEGFVEQFKRFESLDLD